MIFLIITTSIMDKAHKSSGPHRNQTYIDAITQTLSVLPSNIQPIIVENNNNTETFLDNFKIPVHYTNNNVLQYQHKGQNELQDIKSVIEAYNIQDDDFIIKLTGRYFPFNDDFFNLVIDEEDNYEVFIKFFNVCTLEYMDNDCVLGFYAMKCKYLKDFNYLKYHETLSMEVQFATYIRNTITKEKIYEVPCLYLRCCFAENLKIVDV